MGAKAWFIAYFDDDPKPVLADKPELDRKASFELATRFFPRNSLTEDGDGELSYLDPDENQIYVGCYSGLRVVAHEELGGDYPSKVDRKWLHPSLGRMAYVHATHSVVDWFAFGFWCDGELVRSLSVSPDNGVQEQIGAPLSFELPYWNREHSVDEYDSEDPYPLPFHPLDLMEASMLHHLGFQFEGYEKDWVCDPIEIPISTYTIR